MSNKRTIDELEILTPDELVELLISEIREASPDFQYILNIITVGCPIDARDEYGNTPLHWSAVYGEVESVKFLLSNGADIHIRDISNGWTPLLSAASSGMLDVFKFLIQKGADVNARYNNGWTALHFLANWGRIEMVVFLLSNGADVNARDEDDKTAWDVANVYIRKSCPELRPI